MSKYPSPKLLFTLREVFRTYPDIKLDAKDISSYAKSIGIKYEPASVKESVRKIYETKDDDYGAFNFKKRELKGRGGLKWIVSLKGDYYKKIGKYELKKSFLERIEENSYHNLFLEDYEFLDKTKESISLDEIEDLKDLLKNYIKRERPSYTLRAGVGIREEIVSERKQKDIEKCYDIIRKELNKTKNKDKFLKQLEWLGQEWGFEKNVDFKPAFWKPTKEGYNFDTIKEVSDDEKIHLTSPILHNLKKLDYLSEHQLAIQLDKPLFSILHGLEVLSGRKTKSCPYKTKGYNCLKMPKLVKKARLISEKY